MELSFKDKEPEPVARTNGGSKAAETPAEEDKETEKQKPVIRNSRGLTVESEGRIKTITRDVIII